MIEIPEAETISKQLKNTIGGKRIAIAVTSLSPHKFVWYHGDPKDYDTLLRGKTINNAETRGGMVEIVVGDAVLLFSDGIVLRFHAREEQRPKKTPTINRI